MLTILSVGYSLAPVGADTPGGAEQILRALDAELVRLGHRSIVVAPEGSEVAGRLAAIPAVRGVIDDGARESARASQREAIARVLGRERVDLVHMHGLDFSAALPPPGVPVLATLHLPPPWYPDDVFRPGRPMTYLTCVSWTQLASAPSSGAILGVIENGVPTLELPAPVRRRGFALALGRVCPEKGLHHALDAAALAGVPLLLGGGVYRYPEHERYFREEITPRLDRSRRFLGSVGWAGKRRLLSAARVLLVPSLAPETSSLVAMEALACGTPVIAFRAGALVEIVEPGRTGFLVDDAAEMAEAIGMVDEIDREECRAVARERFDQRRMLAGYIALYHALTGVEART